MAPDSDPQSKAATFAVGAVLALTLDAFFRRLGHYVLLSLACHLPYLAARMAMLSEGRALGAGEHLFLDGGLQLVSESVLGALVIHDVVLEANGGRASLSKTFWDVLPRLTTVVLVGVIGQLFFLPLIVEPALQLGVAGNLLIFLISVCGVFAMCVLWVAPAAILVERASVLGSLGRSITLTAGRRWGIFGLLLLYLAAGILLVLLLEGLLSLANVQGGLAETLILDGVSIFMAPVFAIATAYSYIYLRIEKEGVDVDALAEVFS